MDLLSFFKGGKYFDKNIAPKCDYCQFGKRAKDGNKVLCEKRGLVDCSYSCNKFAYSPLKRIPVKQLNFVGSLADEDIYIESAGDRAEKEAEKKAQESKENAKNIANAPVQPPHSPDVKPEVHNAEPPKPAVTPLQPIPPIAPIPPQPQQVQPAAPVQPVPQVAPAPQNAPVHSPEPVQHPQNTQPVINQVQPAVTPVQPAPVANSQELHNHQSPASAE